VFVLEQYSIWIYCWCMANNGHAFSHCHRIAGRSWQGSGEAQDENPIY